MFDDKKILNILNISRFSLRKTLLFSKMIYKNRKMNLIAIFPKLFILKD